MGEVSHFEIPVDSVSVIFYCVTSHAKQWFETTVHYFLQFWFDGSPGLTGTHSCLLHLAGGFDGLQELIYISCSWYSPYTGKPLFSSFISHLLVQ
jgi:hypothetical protein